MIFISNSLDNSNIMDNTSILVCEAECKFNRDLPRLRWSVSVPLAAIVRISRTTAVIAKLIMLMLGGDRYRRKMFAIFESNLYVKAINTDRHTLNK